jgi:hypothetical protein
MAYLKFQNDEKLYNVKVRSQGNIVTLLFSDEKIVNISGFDLYLDKEGQKNIGGNTYHAFTTIYKNDVDDNNSYQLSNDGTVYTAPEIVENDISEADYVTDKAEYVSDRQLINEQNDAIIELAEIINEQNDAILELASIVSSANVEDGEVK